MTKSCAFLTLKDREGFYIYDHLLFEPLAKIGWSVKEIAWDETNIDWGAFDAVVIRSPWDYQNAPEAFMKVLEQIEKVTPLYNSVAICRWNMNKEYLGDLQEKGLQIVPTYWLDSLTEQAVIEVFAATEKNKIVVKPRVGANADDTFVLKAEKPETWQQPLEVFTDRKLMAQPFVESINIEGEYSLFYFGGEYSHAIVKRPADGDFRVQEEHGGQISKVEPDNDLVEAGKKAMEAIPETLLYARVDLVRLDDGSPAIIEIELIEPSLYFDQCPDSPEKFAAAFNKIVKV